MLEAQLDEWRKQVNRRSGGVDATRPDVPFEHFGGIDGERSQTGFRSHFAGPRRYAHEASVELGRRDE